MFHYSSGMQAVVAAAGVCGRASVFWFGKDPGAQHQHLGHTPRTRSPEPYGHMHLLLISWVSKH